MQAGKCVLIWTLLLLFPQLSAANSKHRDLESRFDKKIVYVRGFYKENDLIFDSRGSVTGQATPGPWTLGLVKVKKIKVGKGELRFDGLRGFSVFDDESGKFEDTFYKKPQKVHIKITADAASLSSSALDELVNRVLATKLTPADVPGYWRDFFSGKAKVEPTAPPGGIVPGELSEGSPVYRAAPKGDVKPARVTVQRQPEYTEEARDFKIQGSITVRLIVNQQGIPEKIQIVKPLGFGLDDEAAKIIQQWRFEPGSIKGRPVPTLVDVGFEFHLY